MSQRQRPPPFTLVIFGASGDLTRRLVVPALYNLEKSGLLPDDISIVGVDHNSRSSDDWAQELRKSLQETISDQSAKSSGAAIDEACWGKIKKSLSYICGDFLAPDTYRKLGACLDQSGGTPSRSNAVFYLAVADPFFGPVVQKLGEAGLFGEASGFRRVVVEKPFGHDFRSAKRLNECLREHLHENQIYRIDHFLGKETVQNIMALRFGNGLFEPIWNRDRIDHVQITVAETLGIGTRGKFYEQTGALRDMVPNHLFQLVAMTAMEPPMSFDADAVRNKKSELLHSIHRPKIEDAVRGQYSVGKIAADSVGAYREEADVAPNSVVETYVALKLVIDNWRWAGVPFYLRTGKRLAKRSTEIAIHFKHAPHAIFRGTEVEKLDADWLILRIQPDEGIRLRFNAKRPGPTVLLESVAMDFHYQDWFRVAPAVGYESLIYDCLIGDPVLFQRGDQVEGAWKIVDPILHAWAGNPPADFPNYAAGSEGPVQADELLARDGRAWRSIR